MREIKFRAWDKKRKSMYKVVYIHFNDHEGAWATVEGNDIIEQKTIHIQIQPKDIELMQYTGLKDKNGLHDIYEGDICDNDGGMIGEVVFHESAWMFRWRSGNYYPLGQWVEIIGNKWDNPELLEPK